MRSREVGVSVGKIGRGVVMDMHAISVDRPVH